MKLFDVNVLIYAHRPNACVLKPGDRNWSIFHDLCLELPAKGKLVADAWHAALAIEYDFEWVSLIVIFPGSASCAGRTRYGAIGNWRVNVART